MPAAVNTLACFVIRRCAKKFSIAEKPRCLPILLCGFLKTRYNYSR